MQGIGQLLASSLLLVSLLSVLAQNEGASAAKSPSPSRRADSVASDDSQQARAAADAVADAKPSQLSKRSADGLDESSAPCRNDAATAASEDATAEQKRFNEFVGKRAEVDDKRYEFVGKRGGPYEFVGKRPYEFLGKRGPYEFLGKRDPYEFVGKRPYEFLGKRNPYEFLGKRTPYEFLGKRSPYEFLGKRSPYEFLGKRSPYEFLGKRSPYEFLGKRTPYEFLGKRSPYEFLGKRNPYEFLGKGMPYEFLGKRSPYEFLGKRNPYEFVGKRALIDFYGKRVQLPYEFVGKRIFGDHIAANVDSNASPTSSTSSAAGNQPSSEASPSVAGAGAGDSKTKRYSEWLGKRGQMTDQLLRDLVNKRISAMVRQRLREGSNGPEFIGRREGVEEVMAKREGLPAREEGFGMKKRYTEFVGK